MRININGKDHDTTKDKRTLNEVLAEIKESNKHIFDPKNNDFDRWVENLDKKIRT